MVGWERLGGFCVGVVCAREGSCGRDGRLQWSGGACTLLFWLSVLGSRARVPPRLGVATLSSRALSHTSIALLGTVPKPESVYLVVIMLEPSRVKIAGVDRYVGASDGTSTIYSVCILDEANLISGVILRVDADKDCFGVNKT